MFTAEIDNGCMTYGHFINDVILKIDFNLFIVRSNFAIGHILDTYTTSIIIKHQIDPIG